MIPSTLSASILSADFAQLADQIHQCESAGCDWIHIDVMDGHFVPNITMGPFIVETCARITSLPLDVHLMIDNSEKFAENFVNAGANWVSIHVEENPYLIETLQKIQDLGAHPSVVVNPATPAVALKEALPFVDMVLVMTVHPGFSGQKFMPEMVSKIAEVKKMIAGVNPQIRLEIDGGVNPGNIRQCAEAGANTFVAASAIFKHSVSIQAGISDLRSQLK